MLLCSIWSRKRWDRTDFGFPFALGLGAIASSYSITLHLGGYLNYCFPHTPRCRFFFGLGIDLMLQYCRRMQEGQANEARFLVYALVVCQLARVSVTTPLKYIPTSSRRRVRADI